MTGPEQKQAREALVRQWFGLWLHPAPFDIGQLFTDDALYIESWGPQYRGAGAIRHWFDEWNTRGRVQQWDIRRFFHSGEETVVLWTFRSRMNDGDADAFDGISLIRWQGAKMCRLQEFGCNRNRYDPYAGGGAPRFRDEPARWF